MRRLAASALAATSPTPSKKRPPPKSGPDPGAAPPWGGPDGCCRTKVSSTSISVFFGKLKVPAR